MGKIKYLLVQHGEKALCLLIVLLCLRAIYGNLVRDPNMMILQEGKTFLVNTEELESKIASINKHIAKDSLGLWENKPVVNMAEIIKTQLRVADAGVATTNLEWLVYAQPPQPREIEKIGPEAPRAAKSEPPIHTVRTRIGAPVEWRVKVGAKGVLILCKDSPAMNWPDDGSVQVMLWRKEAGVGRETLTKEQRDAFMDVVSGTAVDVKDDESSTDSFFPGESEWAGFGGQNAPRRVETESANVVYEGNFDFSIAEGLPKSPTAFFNAVSTLELETGKHVRLLVEPTVQVPTAWKPLAGKMSVYGEPLTEEQIEAILEDGTLPEETGGAAPDAAVDAPGQPATPGAPKLDIWGNPIVEKRAPANAAMPTVARGFSEGAVAGGGEVPAYTPRYYAFFDKKTDENTVYRYRMVAYCKVKDIPADVRAVETHTKFVPYCEMGDIGERRFALTTPELKAYVTQEQEKKTVGARGLLAQPVPVAFEGDTAEELALLNVAGLRDVEGRRTSRALAYARENAFSLFTYTDVVLTPVKRRIVLNSALQNNITKQYDTARITVEAIKGLESFSKPYAIQKPQAMHDITWQHFMLRDADGKVKLDAEYSPVLKELADVYEPVLRQEAVELEPVGKDNELVGGERLDFATGWGLVDIRRCNVIVKRYKEPGANDAPAVSEDRGEREGDMGVPPVRRANKAAAAKEKASVSRSSISSSLQFKNRSVMGRAYIVIRELNPPAKQRPRYKRVIQKLPPLEQPYTIEIDWEPEFAEKAADQISQKYLLVQKSTVSDWKQFCLLLKKDYDNGERTPAKRIMDFIGDEGRRLVEEGAVGGLTDDRLKMLMNILNQRIIDTGRFYSVRYFKNIPVQVQKRLELDLRSLSKIQMREVNRWLFELAAPELIHRYVKK